MRKEEVRESGGVRYLVFQNLIAAGVLHGFSLRFGGVSEAPYDSLNLGLHVGDDAENVWDNRKRLAGALGYAVHRVTVGQQIHGTEIARVTPDLVGRGHQSAHDAIFATDGLVCTESGVVLMAHSADCTLLYFFDPVTRCIGLAHAGWRGAVAGMGPKMVEAMVQLGCTRENIRVALAPTIGPCCYRVGDNVVEQIPTKLQEKVCSRQNDGLYLDLPGLQRLQLLAAGITDALLIKSDICTNCSHDSFFSYRASGGQTGRMAGVISLAK